MSIHNILSSPYLVYGVVAFFALLIAVLARVHDRRQSKLDRLIDSASRRHGVTSSHLSAQSGLRGIFSGEDWYKDTNDVFGDLKARDDRDRAFEQGRHSNTSALD